MLITPHHLDHVGSLTALVHVTGATVHAPAVDAPVIRGEVKPPGPNRAKLSGRTIGRVVERIGLDQTPCHVDVELHDGDRLEMAGGIRVVTSPGHTRGARSVPAGTGLRRADRGRRGRRRGDKVGPPIGALFGMFTEDLDEAVRSFHKLAALEFEVAITGHGNPVRSGALRPVHAEPRQVPVVGSELATTGLALVKRAAILVDDSSVRDVNEGGPRRYAGWAIAVAAVVTVLACRFPWGDMHLESSPGVI